LQDSSTSSFLHYLYRECDELGVRFRFDQEVINIEKTKQAKITSVDIARVGNHDRVVEVPCHNIIVAAGSHSLDALHEIVPWIEPRTTLVNDQQYCDWVSFKGPTISNLNQVGLVVHNTTGTDPVIVAAQAPKQLLVATVRPFDNADPKTTKEPTSDAFLIAKGRFGGLIDSAKMSEGRTIVSTAMDELPHVCRIPSYFIDDRFSDFENESTLGIYLAYGFGMYGTTLSLGVAVALRRMLAGGDAGIGDEFGYPMMDGDDAESGNEPQFLSPPLLYRFV
jgi:glycine/D-amino acid oxidase-like deaminating enzyme